MPSGRPQQQALFADEDLPQNLAPWEIAAANEWMVAEVVFNLPLETPYSYMVPLELRDMLAVGQRVEVQFGQGNKKQRGFCVGISFPDKLTRNLKPLVAILDREPIVSQGMLELAKWIADRYLCGWGQVLESIIPAGVKSQAGTREILFHELPLDLEVRLAKTKLPPKQLALVNALKAAGRPMAADELTQAAGCGVGPLHSLREKGLVVPLRSRVLTAATDTSTPEPHTELILNQQQTAAVTAIHAAMNSSTHATFLLHGVTGSGKTEVYIRAIEQAVAFGRQAIVLVPEISLTPQTIRRFRSRFNRVAVLHSHLTDPERHTYWKQIADGEVEVIVGARSAVFAPTPHLGLIVIDEEHETSFKQDNVPRYHARDVARERARRENVPLILGSATPTLESWVRVARREDTLLSMPDRVKNRPMPPVVITDIRDDPYISQGGALGRALLTAMRENLNAGGQIILFLNVRGFAPVLWCRACGKGMKCPHCDLTLTWHKLKGVALCHSCDYTAQAPSRCPNCQSPGLRMLGTGTERLEAEVQARFPNVPVLRMDSDSMQKRGSHNTALERFRHGEVRILLGTQMIAKGLDFPNVTLVGVVDADTSLHQPDLRASERTFQLIAQVAGRTGRGEKGGKVLVQTSAPNQPAIVFAARHDYLGFAGEELSQRKMLEAPPYAVMARVVVRGPSEADTEAFATTIGATLRQHALVKDGSIRILGPAPCLVTRLKTLFRFHLQMTASTLLPIQTAWRETVAKLPGGQGVEYIIDVEPMSLR